MGEELKHLTHLRKQHLHLLTTPRVSCWSLHGVGDQRVGLEFLASRCKVSTGGSVCGQVTTSRLQVDMVTVRGWDGRCFGLIGHALASESTNVAMLKSEM